MTWFKMDDRITEHAKTRDLSSHELALYIESLAYCSRNLTDGQFPRSEAIAWARRRRIPHPSRPIAGLIQVGCWSAPGPEQVEVRSAPGRGQVGSRSAVDDEMLQIVDYLQHQRSRSQIETERDAAADRKRKSRDSHGDVTPPESEAVPEAVPEQRTSDDYLRGLGNEQASDDVQDHDDDRQQLDESLPGSVGWRRDDG